MLCTLLQPITPTPPPRHARGSFSNKLDAESEKRMCLSTFSHPCGVPPIASLFSALPSLSSRGLQGPPQPHAEPCRAPSLPIPHSPGLSPTFPCPLRHPFWKGANKTLLQCKLTPIPRLSRVPSPPHTPPSGLLEPLFPRSLEPS